MTVIVRHGTRGLLLSHLNVEKMFVVDRFLPPSPPPPFSRGFIAAKMIWKKTFYQTLVNQVKPIEKGYEQLLNTLE